MQSLPQRSMQRNRGKQQNGKTRELFKKIRGHKGMFDAKTGTVKDRSSKCLTETGEIKKRWQEYTEELNKKRSSQPR